jgi:hypothetical protein
VTAAGLEVGHRLVLPALALTPVATREELQAAQALQTQALRA